MHISMLVASRKRINQNHWDRSKYIYTACENSTSWEAESQPTI